MKRLITIEYNGRSYDLHDYPDHVGDSARQRAESGFHYWLNAVVDPHEIGLQADPKKGKLRADPLGPVRVSVVEAEGLQTFEIQARPYVRYFTFTDDIKTTTPTERRKPLPPRDERFPKDEWLLGEWTGNTDMEAHCWRRSLSSRFGYHRVTLLRSTSSEGRWSLVIHGHCTAGIEATTLEDAQRRAESYMSRSFR